MFSKECVLSGLSRRVIIDHCQEYRDPQRAYADVAQTLAFNPTFAPRTDVYSTLTSRVNSRCVREAPTDELR